MLGIMAGMNWKDSYVARYIVESHSGMCMAGTTGCLLLALCSLLLSSAQMLVIMAGMDQKDSNAVRCSPA